MGRYFFMIIAILLALVAWSWRDTFNAEDMKGKRVVITGASTGIGEQLAYEYAKLGAKIVITARREARLKEVVTKCREVGNQNGEYYYYAADMANLNGTKDFIQFAEKKLGGIDYLVLNHIIVAPLQEWTGTEDNFYYLDKILDVNFKAYVHLTTHALKALEASKGSIVVLSSIAGKIGMPYTAVYGASKAALYNFYGSLRQEFKLKNIDISVTTCVIGFIGTENALHGLESFGLQKLLSSLNAASPKDTAIAIIKGGAAREREIFYPYLDAKFSSLFRDWFPDTLEWTIRKLYSKES